MERKEAIEVIKKNYPHVAESGSQFEIALRMLIPELSESKDERVRKTLKKYFINSFQNNGVAAICGMHIKDILAWLEKQGKNNMSISEATKQVLEDNLNKALEKETPESCNEFLEKQGEQKTAEEYNITGIGSKNAQGKLGEMIKNLKPVNEVLEQKTADNKDYSAPLDIEIPFGAKDSELIQETIRIPDGCHAFIKGNEIVIKKEEKPAWSEENKTMVEDIIEAIDTQYAVTDYNEMVNWLKSLKERYTWKPSDEQINALEYYIYSTSPTATITKGTIYGNLMVELLEQLKKLKGE